MRDISYDLTKKAMDVASLRQRLYSSNVSNFNTPGYKANKVRFEEFFSKNTLPLMKTHNDHQGPEPLDYKVGKRENTYVNDNGNNVDVDLEMTEIAANEINFRTLVRQASSKLSSLNYVVNKS